METHRLTSYSLGEEDLVLVVGEDFPLNLDLDHVSLDVFSKLEIGDELYIKLNNKSDDLVALFGNCTVKSVHVRRRDVSIYSPLYLDGHRFSRLPKCG